MLLLCCVLGVLRAGAQSSPMPEIRYIGIEQGLSNNAVTSVYQDYQGFMWFTTYDGLNRYDGMNFTVFRNRIGDSSSLRGNEVYTIAADEHRQLWVGGRNGVSIYHPDQNSFSSLPLNFSVPFIMASGHDMLVATERGGLLVFANEHDPGRQIPLQDGSVEYSVAEIERDKSQGDIWLFVQNKGLCHYEASRRRVVVVNAQILQGNCLRSDGAGHLWLGNDNGLYRYDIAGNQFGPSITEGNFKVSNLTIDQKGVLWIGTDGRGVLLLDPGAAQTRPFVSPAGKPVVNSSAVYAIYEDSQGRKWIGTLRGGVNLLEAGANPIRTVVYQPEREVDPNNNFILSFCEDSLHNLWIGTDGGGLRYWDRQTDRYRSWVHESRVKGSVCGNFITGILRDVQGRLWVSAWYGGISRWNPVRKNFDQYACHNPYTHATENKVWFLYEDERRTLWASTSNDGSLYAYDQAADRFVLFDSSIANIQCLAEDREGHLWGGDYSSLILIDRDGKKHRRYPVGYTVRCIHEDRSGQLWIGTQGGALLLFDRTNGHFKRFTEADGLRSNTILRILEDREGNLWMSSFNGLIRYDARDKVFRHYTASDGLQSNQFSFNAAIALQSGEFAFGGIKGFNLFYPDSVGLQAPLPNVYLTGIRVGDRVVEAQGQQELRIPYDSAALSFDFVAPEYSAPDKIQYAYMLEGWDKGWNYSPARTANYTRLQEGTYHFLIRATNALGRWGPEKKVLTLVVLPPWYRTWWAWTCYILILLGTIYLYIMYTRRQERLRYEIKLAHLENEKNKELNEKKLDFFSNVSHEFRTPLTLIINPLRQSLAQQEKRGADKDLTIAYRNARRLLSLVDQLLLFRKADSGADMLRVSKLDIDALCREVFQFFVQQARQHAIDYRLESAGDLPVLYGDRQKIEIALFNLLSNAFKYTPDGGHILLELRQGGDRVLVTVGDSGCGIPVSERAAIFEKFRQVGGQGASPKTGFGIGLYLVKHFIEDHRGELSCESEVGSGSRFTIALQAGRAHLPAHQFVEEGEADHGLLEELRPEEEEGVLIEEMPVSVHEGRKVEEIVTDKRSILLIDDDAGIRQYLEHIFSDRYLLYQAADGEEGWRLAVEHLPDLLISDINMQGMDGVALCQAIKSSETLGHIPVILLTGETAIELQLKGIEGGADDYITKPFDSHLLQARVETILKNRNLLQRYFFDSVTLRETAIKVPAEYQDFLRRCIEVIELHLDADDFNTQKFAQEMGMSRSGLYQKVKSISGQSLNAFIRSIRLRRAAVLMLRENMNINQAAFLVGIGDVRYFREQFVKLFDMTPSEYIKKYRASFNRDFNVIRRDVGGKL